MGTRPLESLTFWLLSQLGTNLGNFSLKDLDQIVVAGVNLDCYTTYSIALRVHICWDELFFNDLVSILSLFQYEVFCCIYYSTSLLFHLV